MVAMYCEDREPHIEIAVFKIHTAAAKQQICSCSLHRTLAETVWQAIVHVHSVHEAGHEPEVYGSSNYGCVSPKSAASPTDEVFRLVAQDLKVHRLVAEGVSCQDVYSSHYGAAGRLVVMEQVATKQDQVYCLLLGILKDFFKCNKRVIFADFIFFPYALQIEGSLAVARQAHIPTDL